MGENIRELDSEKQKLDADLEKLKKELETSANEISKINSWLESFSELEAMLCDETELYNKQQSAYILLQKLIIKQPLMNMKPANQILTP